MLGSHDVLFATAYALGLTQYVINGRRRMMVVRVFSSLLWGVYLSMINGYAGAAACLIATIGCFIQAAVPDHMLARTLKARLVGAVTLAGAASVICARTAGDLLPLMAVVIGRFVEIQACQQRIRMGMVFCKILWILYHYSQGFLLLYCSENIGIMVNLAAIWRQERKSRKQALAAACAV